jgi:signal transduction histidine kinase
MSEHGRRSPAALEEVERVLDRFAFPAPPDERQSARARAHAVLESGRQADARNTLAIDLLTCVLVDVAARPAACRAVMDELELAGVSRSVLGTGVLSAPTLLQLPTAVALQVQLTLLLACTGARAVSLWTLPPGLGDTKHLAYAGEFNVNELHTRHVARRLLSGLTPGPYSEGPASGVLLQPFGREPTALIARGGRSRSETVSLLEAAVAILSETLGRERMFRGKGRFRRNGVPSAEGRLAQLRLDLHDGPQQDVVLLAEDLRLFRAQLESVASWRPVMQRLLGRVDDLVARLVVLDGDLRKISGSLAGPFAQSDPVINVLLSLTEAFSARSGIEPEFSLKGNLDHLSEAQLTTLTAVLRETLSNIRKHSGATSVAIAITAADEDATLTVVDNGRGFDPEPALIRAARDGHIGLAGMHERVKALGGRVDIDSRPGGPTVISAVLPVTRRRRTRARTRKKQVVPAV